MLLYWSRPTDICVDVFILLAQACVKDTPSLIKFGFYSDLMVYSHYTGLGLEMGMGQERRPGSMVSNIYVTGISVDPNGLFTLHETGTGRGTEKWWVSILFYVLCTTQGQGQTQGIIVFYCTHPVPSPCPGSVQCVWAITLRQRWREDKIFGFLYVPMWQKNLVAVCIN